MNGKVPGAHSSMPTPVHPVVERLRGSSMALPSTLETHNPCLWWMVYSSITLPTPAGLNTVTAAARGSSASTRITLPAAWPISRRRYREHRDPERSVCRCHLWLQSRCRCGAHHPKRGKSGKTKLTLSQDLGFVKARNCSVQEPGLKKERKHSVVMTRSAPHVKPSSLQHAMPASSDYEKEMYGETGLTQYHPQPG